jgi:uroporphyrinogen III methyltransferase/synthase
MSPRPARGKVYLVGAGPGDPGLLTVRGRELIERADLLLHDRLVNPALLRLARPGARVVAAGRRGARAAARQRRIDALMIRAARRGLTVVRLKGGDPFVFGRGGEEAETLAEAGIDFEVVPGVTSAVAAAACAGIPLTHRRWASSALLATGHEDPRSPGRLRWPEIAAAADTLVFLMALRRLPALLRRLVRHGRPASTPAALIERGTWPCQRVIEGTLATLAARARAARARPPALLVAGEVVRLRRRIAWFERRPLWGLRVLVTRARAQAAELSRRLEEAGAEVREFAAVEIAPPSSWRAADRAIAALGRYDWIVFTSVNGVDAFLDRMARRGRDARALAGARLAAIGAATARRLRERGLRADVQPREYRAEALAAALRGRARGARVLVARAKVARDFLPRALRRGEGARVDVVEVYRTLRPRAGAAALRRAFERREIDLVTLTSSSTVLNLVRALGGRRRARRLLRGVAAACIGPITAATARACGLRVRVQPRDYTVPALAREIVRAFGGRRRALRSSRAGTRRRR